MVDLCGSQSVQLGDFISLGKEAVVLRTEQTEEWPLHVDVIGVHLFSSRYLLCFCSFVIRPAQTHTHTHTFQPFPLSLSLFEWVLCS